MMSPKTSIVALGCLCTSSTALAWNVGVQLSADNAYAIYTGDATSVTAVHGTAENTLASHIRDAESYNFTMADGESIYVVTWSDDRTSQGLLAEFNIDGTILTTSNSDWEVMATGIDLDLGDAAPSLSDLTTQIGLANAGSTPSGGWVPSTIGELNDGTGPMFGTLEVTSMASTINWAWYDSGSCSGSQQPFRTGCDHEEYLVFRLPLPLGGCCLEDGSCLNTSEENCADEGGIYAGAGVFCEEDGTCDTGGACCVDGSCIDDMPEDDCKEMLGTWYGLGSDCMDADVECLPEPDTGACCVDDTCYDITVDECEERAGTWYGLGSDCADPDIECPVEETGACCVDDICYDIVEDECKERLGTWYGLGSDCADPDIECPVDDELGACCLEDECVMTTAEECWAELGSFYGPDSSCDDAYVECCEDSGSTTGSSGSSDDDEELPSIGCSTLGGNGLDIKDWLPLILVGCMVGFRRRR